MAIIVLVPGTRSTTAAAADSVPLKRNTAFSLRWTGALGVGVDYEKNHHHHSSSHLFTREECAASLHTGIHSLAPAEISST